MSFHVYETQQDITAKQRPIIIITSNNEKDLPDAFLRRCFFHYINFPTKNEMQEIIDVHYPRIKEELIKESLEVFFNLREVNNLKKKPSTSELIDWLKLLMSDELIQQDLINQNYDVIPLLGALLKNEQDTTLIEKLGFLK